MDTSHGRKEAVWRRKLYKVLHQAKDAEEDQRLIGMTTSLSGLR